MKLEKTLLKRLKKHDKKAQLLFYRECFSVMMGAALRYKKNKEDASALVNEAFLKVLTNIDKYDRKKPLEAWLRRIVINCAIDEFRASKKNRELFGETAPEHENLESSASYNEAIESFEIEEIEQLLANLPKATYLVFNLYALDGYSHKEVSEQLGITVETSKWHVKQARKKLRNIIGMTSTFGGLLISLIDIV